MLEIPKFQWESVFFLKTLKDNTFNLSPKMALETLSIIEKIKRSKNLE